MNNLAGDAGAKDILIEHRGILDRWIRATGDKGRQWNPKLFTTPTWPCMQRGRKALRARFSNATSRR